MATTPKIEGNTKNQKIPERTYDEIAAENDYLGKRVVELLGQLQLAEKENEKTNLDTQIADLTQAISNLNDDIAGLKAEVADAQVEMKRASENREKENAEFQQTVADQRATQTILKKALTRLQAFYAKKGFFLQVRRSMRQAPPGEFGERKGAGQAAGGVVAMLENIINDSKRMESEALQAEQDARFRAKGVAVSRWSAPSRRRRRRRTRRGGDARGAFAPRHHHTTRPS